MAGRHIADTAVKPEWIDYNGHLRDAYYAVILSEATDTFMDLVGIDAPYRERTKCTLYTLEMHLHYLLEVKQSDALSVRMRLIGHDRKRIHASFEMFVPRYETPVCTAEVMMLHVHQGETVGSAAFPESVAAELARWQTESDGLAPTAPASRAIALRR